MVARPLPAELGLLVIDHIGADADKDYGWVSDAKYLKTLRICALVCKDWLHRSRFYLLWSIYIQDKAGFESLKTTFHDNPSFRHLVRVIYVTTDYEESQLHFALLLLRKMPSSTFKLIVSDNIPLDTTSRRCLSMGYPHILHLHFHSINVPINRVHLLVNAFPSLQTLSYSRVIDDGPVCSKYMMPLNHRRSRLTVRVHVIRSYGTG